MRFIGFVYFKVDMALLSYACQWANIIERKKQIFWANDQIGEICKET